MSRQTLEILSDQQENAMVHRLREKYEQKVHETKTLINKGFDLIIGVIKQSMQGTEAEKDAIIKKRIKEMFCYNVDLATTADYYCQRIQPDYSSNGTQQIQPIFNQVLVYGTDFWSCKAINNSIKQKYDLEVQVQRINPSNTIIKFKTAQDARKWLLDMAQQQELLKSKMEEQRNQEDQWRGWIKLKPYYYVQGIIRNRQARYVTSKEQSMDRAQMSMLTVDSQIQKQKQKIIKDLLKDFNAEEKYQQALQKQRKQNSKLMSKKHRYRKDNSFNTSYHNHSKNTIGLSRKRERSRQKRVDRSRFQQSLNINDRSFMPMAESRVRNVDHMNNSISKSNASDMSYDFLLEPQSKNNESNMSFIEDFNKKLNVGSGECSLDFKNKKANQSLEDLLKVEEDHQPVLMPVSMSFSKKQPQEKSKFSYSAYIEEQQRKNNIFQL